MTANVKDIFSIAAHVPDRYRRCFFDRIYKIYRVFGDKSAASILQIL
ncbi:MAG: hypothetical protein KF734_10575 [Saprospiraceae bacterium]|nr:hypothetical protein [Saprospiraceae bacterium]